MNLSTLCSLVELILVGLTHSDKLGEATEPEPQINRDSQTEITFDMENINENEITVKRGQNNQARELFNFFQFEPKPGVAIGSLVLDGAPVWKNAHGTRADQVTVVKNGFVHLYYAVKLTHATSGAHIVNFKFPTMSFSDIGLAEYLESLHSWYADAGAALNKCNMLSAFDYNFASKKVRVSPDGSLKAIVIEPSVRSHFDQVLDGAAVVHSAERVRAIEILSSLGKRCLMRLETEDGEFIHFKFADQWSRVQEPEYLQLFARGRFAECTVAAAEQPAPTPDRFQISGTGRQLYENKHVFLTVPALSYVFTQLSQIWDGEQLVFDRPLRNGSVILYKGAFSHELMEVVHSEGPCYGSVLEFSLSGLSRDGQNVRQPNLYFIRSGGRWCRCGQAEFLERFRAVAVGNLEECSAQLRRHLDLAERRERERLLKTLDANDRLLAFLRGLSLDNAGVGPTSECRLDEFLRFEFLRPFVPRPGPGTAPDQPADPADTANPPEKQNPPLAIAYPSEPEPLSYTPEPSLFTAQHKLPDPEPEPAPYSYRFGGNASPRFGRTFKQPEKRDLALKDPEKPDPADRERRRVRRLLLGLPAEDGFCAASLLLILPLILLAL